MERKVAILLISDYGADSTRWKHELSSRFESIDFRVWPECGDKTDIDVIFMDTVLGPGHSFCDFPNLKWVGFIGHGVGYVLRDASLPADVIVTRLESGAMARSMAEYAVHAVLHHHLRVDDYKAQQDGRIWKRLPIAPASTKRAAVLGLGIIGRTTARYLLNLGFKVAGWSQTPKDIEGVKCVHGNDALPALLSESDFVIALLPDTERTKGLLDRKMLSCFKQGSYLVNLGRGSLIVEDDLVAALGQEKIAGADLDVFSTEPLPEHSPLWAHPRVRVTPHGGFASLDEEPYSEFCENYRLYLANKPMMHVADRARGY